MFYEWQAEIVSNDMLVCSPALVSALCSVSDQQLSTFLTTDTPLFFEPVGDVKDVRFVPLEEKVEQSP